jgi:uncharacterized protein YpuA (DUF1002 family)
MKKLREKDQIQAEKLTAILTALQKWNGSLEDADKIFAMVKEKLADESLLKSLNPDNREIVKQIAAEYNVVISGLKIQRMTVKRQLLELTYSRDKMHAYLNQQRYPLINFNY